MMQFFRIVGFLEGLSFLALLLIAMPLKYYMGVPMAVKMMGPLHGGLFLAYCVSAYLVASENKWPAKQHLLAYIAAVVPFGTFLFDRRFLVRA